jgi:GntR family transcriptional regulator/MocR family aminotransferase
MFPRLEWARAVRFVLRDLKSSRLGYPNPAGTFELRASLTQYLCRVRGLEADASRVIVCNGCVQALGIAARTLALRGVRRIAVEDPGHPDVRRIMSDAGLEPVGVPIDHKGVIVSALDRAGVEAAVLTPAHQFPSGHVLDPDRRRELIAWAESVDAFVIEDDVDAEFRYDRHPIGALQGLAPHRVLYASSASKTLAPALRLGWLVAPKDLCHTATEVKKYMDLGTPVLDQLTYVELLSRGSVDRHLRRMRSVYRSRRDALLVALGSTLPDWEPQGAAAGLHVLVKLPRGLSEEAVVRAAESQSVRVYPTGSYRIKAGPDGLIMGYASLDEREIARGITQLAQGL